jgi:hypothetical protein
VCLPAKLNEFVSLACIIIFVLWQALVDLEAFSANSAVAHTPSSPVRSPTIVSSCPFFISLLSLSVVSLSLSLSLVSLSIYPSIYLSINLSLYLHACLSVWAGLGWLPSYLAV